MKILFVAEFYAPDSAIGAVRISKLSKYLKLFGHEVTVLCSDICAAKKDDSMLNELDGISIHRYNTPNGIEVKQGKSRKRDTHFVYKKIVKLLYKNILYPISYIWESNVTRDKMVDYYNTYLCNNGYDVVFATFSPRASIEAGLRISSQCKIPLIIDLRDLMDSVSYPLVIREWNSRLQRYAISNSACTYVISNGQKKVLSNKYSNLSSKIEVLSNGYDNIVRNNNFTENYDEVGDSVNQEQQELVFVYTGLIYGGKRDITPLYKAIKEINESLGYIFRFIYAGTESYLVRSQMKKYGIESFLDDRGVLSRSEAELVHNRADIFVVASWNYKNEQGIMTGKFYDGIRSEKSMLTLVDGNEPDSDLFLLNERYHYGYCYESYKINSYSGLKEYVKKCYEQKIEMGYVKCNQTQELKDRFMYKNIARQLEKRINELVSKEV